MSHHCTSAIVHCMDFRFQHRINDFIIQQGLEDDVDRIAIAGGIKNLGEAFQLIQTSIQLHDTRHVYLLNHQDCGAYGPAVAEDPTRELETHTRDLRIMHDLLQSEFPELNIHLYFMTLDGQIVPVEPSPPVAPRNQSQPSIIA